MLPDEIAGHIVEGTVLDEDWRPYFNASKATWIVLYVIGSTFVVDADQGIDNLNDVDGRLLHRYKVHRRDDRGLGATTVQGDFDTLAMFIAVM